MEDVSCRYSESKGYWMLSVMDGTGARDLGGRMGDQPEWLFAIRDAAKLSGNGWFTSHDTLIWFRMDSNNDLTEFIQWMVN